MGKSIDRRHADFVRRLENGGVYVPVSKQQGTFPRGVFLASIGRLRLRGIKVEYTTINGVQYCRYYK